jgi:hypothetical protein
MVRAGGPWGAGAVVEVDAAPPDLKLLLASCKERKTKTKSATPSFEAIK